jgi:hypothetical protein
MRGLKLLLRWLKMMRFLIEITFSSVAIEVHLKYRNSLHALASRDLSLPVKLLEIYKLRITYSGDRNLSPPSASHYSEIA